MVDELRQLRDEIATIDYQILKLIANRLQLARQAGKIKLDRHQPVAVADVERQVIDRNRAIASDLKLPDTLVDQLTMLLIDYATKAQTSVESASKHNEANLEGN